MSFLGDVGRVCLSDMYYLKRNILILLVTSLITPLLYLVAFGWGLGSGITMHYGGHDYTYIAYMIPGVVALTTLTSAFNTISNKLLIQRRFYESFDEMMLCPVSKMAIVFGKSILGIIKALLCATIMLILGFVLAGDLQMTPMLVVSVVVSSITFALLGVAAGLMISDLPHMNAFNSFVILPMTFLCGTMFPVDKIPSVVGWIVDILPLTPASGCIRAAALGADFPWFSLVILLVWAVVFFAIACFALRQSD